MGDDKKKYIAMEPILNSINRDYISLSDAEKRRNNEILKSVITKITDLMKEEDIMFKTMYSRVFYAGSYYDGLRVGHPEEYDLDLLLSVPKFATPVITTSNKPGFVHLQFKDFARFLKQPEASVKYRQLNGLLDDSNYFLTNRVRQWMEGVVTKALNKCPKDGSFYQLNTPMSTFKLGVTKGGPAITLKLEGTVKGERVKMDIDLVPCFVFSGDKWPADGFKRNPVPKKPDYFIVPKSPKCGGGPRYWRLSFQEQERELIDGKRTLKPTIKLLKLLRDREGHACIASYYIKTILISLVESKPDEFWKDPLSSVFMKVLKEYQQHMNNKQIIYFWNKKNNLLDNLRPELIMNINNRLKVIIKDIDNHLDNPKIVTKYLLTTQEMN